MLIKLPIILNNKINYTLFRLIKLDKCFTLSLMEKIDSGNIIKILCSNKINGIDYLNIYLPLKIYQIENYLINIYFFYINLTNDENNKINFFFELNTILMNNYNLKFIEFQHFKKYESKIYEFINNQYLTLINNKWFNDNFLEIINLLINTTGFVLWMDTNKKLDKLPKNIHKIINLIKLIKYELNNSNKYTLVEHIDKIDNKILSLSDIVIDKQYFISINNNKNIFIKVISKNNNLIKVEGIPNDILFDTYKWYNYSHIDNNKLNKIYLHLLKNKDIYKVIITKLTDAQNINNITSYYYDEPNKSLLNISLINDNINELDIIKSANINFEFFKYICDKYSNTNSYKTILENLFINYTYTIKYNKKEVDPHFDYILYFSILNINTILTILDNNKILLNNDIIGIIPSKLKILYFNILKYIHVLINGNDNVISKYIVDNIHRQFMKILFSSESYSLTLLKSLISNQAIEEYKSHFLINNILIDIINKLSWNFINFRLNYLKKLFDNKEYLLFYDKLNKNIFPDNFDNKIKLIIINPFEMFKYLRKEADFIKWIIFLENKYTELYISYVLLNNDELVILGKIIYNLVNIKEQQTTDNYYNKFIYYGLTYPKLILENNRINLKIKDHFGYLKCNLNLGILAKRLTYNKDIVELDNQEDSEITILKNKLLKVTQKYLKYKKKYLKYKKI